MTRLAITVAVVLAMLAGAFWAGDVYGAGRLQARMDAQTVAAQAQAAETSKALAAAEQARRQMAQKLEDDANEEPVASPACLPVSRVRRLAVR